MRLKNRKATLAVGVAAALLALAGLGLFRWWSSGAIPAAPSTFLETEPVEQAAERLRASRLDQRPLLSLCADVLAHLKQAQSVSFTNPEEALAAVQALESDLARIEVAHQRLLEETAGAGAPEWQQHFHTFTSTAADAYAKARAACRALLRPDLDTLSYRSLLDLVVAGKDAFAALPSYPPWRQHEELSRRYYPAYEQAYRVRQEQDPAVVEARLREANPAPVRWFYARLYESLLPVPPAACADGLQQEAARVLAVQDDLRASDPTELLMKWPFLTRRAGHLRRLADTVRPLERAESAADWLAAWEASRTARAELDAQLRPNGTAPDPAVRTRLEALDRGVRTFETAYRHVAASDHVEAQDALAELATRLLAESAGCCSCPLRPLQELRDANEALRAAETRMLAVAPLADAPVAETLLEARTAADRFSRTLGVDIAARRVARTFDAWCSERWPAWSEVPALAGHLREVVQSGALPDPRLAVLSRFLEQMHDDAGSAQASALLATWSRELRATLSDYPALQTRLDAALSNRRDERVLAELEALIETGDDAALRGYLDALAAQDATGVPQDLRALSAQALSVLRLSERIGDLRVDDLPRFAERNADRLPPAPPADSVLYPLYAKRVLPLLDLAQRIVRLRAADRESLPAELDRAAEERAALAGLYPGWHALDDPLARAAVAAAPHLLVLRPAPLTEASRRVARMLGWEGMSDATRERVLDVQRLLAAGTLFLGTAPCAPGYADWIETSRAVQARLSLASAEWDQLVLAAETASRFCAAWDEAPNSFRLLRERFREADAVIAESLRHLGLADGALPEFLDRHRAALRDLHPVVDADMQTMASPSATAAGLLNVAATYRRYAQPAVVPPRLAAYALAQADCLEHCAEGRPFRLEPVKTPADRVRIDLAVLKGAPATLGYGERWARRGEHAALWLESGAVRGVLLRGSWREEEGALILRREEVNPVQGVTSWGTPITLGLSVAHAGRDDRNLVPDAGTGQSRWNPANYGLFRVRTNEYPIATFASLEAMLRELRQPVAAQIDYWVRFDSVLRTSGASEGEPDVLAYVQELPSGRDMDWPEILEPLTEQETRELGRELRGAVDGFLRDGTLPNLLDP